jgi:ElaB/YqjD/DUF883 family membrane-anchored ribosome-binding protein
MKTQTMNKHTHTAAESLDNLAADAKALVTATRDLASEKAAAARERVTAALNQTWQGAKTRALDGAKATDEVLREHPYHAIGIAVGVGAALGYLLARRE